MKTARLLLLSLVFVASCLDDDNDDGGVVSDPTSVPPTPIESCYTNLQLLWDALQSYETTYGSLPNEQGGAFWLKLSNVSPQLVDPATGVYQCPLTGNPASGITIDYRGPSSNANSYAAGDPICADKFNNHDSGGITEGGHVLFKDGTILLVGPADPAFIGIELTP